MSSGRFYVFQMTQFRNYEVSVSIFSNQHSFAVYSMYNTFDVVHRLLTIQNLIHSLLSFEINIKMMIVITAAMIQTI